MRRRLEALYDAAAYLAALFLGGTLAMVLTGIAGRLLHFHVPGTDSYAGYCMAACGFERLVDLVARKLKMDPAEIRKKNFIPPFKDGHTVATGLVYDSGNYIAAFDKALKTLDYAGLRRKQAEARQKGEHMGIGFCTYAEICGLGPSQVAGAVGFGGGLWESAIVRFHPSGKVNVFVGISPHGQGEETTFAQIVSEQLGVAVGDVPVVTGDTAEFHWGTGSFASRGVVVAGNAIHAAAHGVRKKVLKLASKMLVTPEHELEHEDGMVRVADIPNKSISLGELAALANPLRGAVEPGTEPGLEATDYYGPQFGTTASGCHAMILEVDPETMMVNIQRYAVVEDCGKIINPLIVEGQVHGGVSMGLGNAYYEKLHFDENAQILNASLADYLIVTSCEMPPRIVVDHFETLSPLNEMGSKGVGEAGAIPVPALLAQALENAFHDRNLEILETPLSPNRLFELLREWR